MRSEEGSRGLRAGRAVQWWQHEKAGVFSLAALLSGLDKWRGPRGTGDGAPRTGPASVQVHEGDSAAGLSCCCCSLTLSRSAASLHLLCALLIALPWSRLCHVVCQQVHISRLFCPCLIKWPPGMCACLFTPCVVSPRCPIPPLVQFRYPKVHYGEWICRGFLLLCLCLFGIFFPNSKISFLPFPVTALAPQAPEHSSTHGICFCPLLSPRAVSVLGEERLSSLKTFMPR